MRVNVFKIHLIPASNKLEHCISSVTKLMVHDVDIQYQHGLTHGQIWKIDRSCLIWFNLAVAAILETSRRVSVFILKFYHQTEDSTWTRCALARAQVDTTGILAGIRSSVLVQLSKHRCYCSCSLQNRFHPLAWYETQFDRSCISFANCCISSYCIQRQIVHQDDIPRYKLCCLLASTILKVRWSCEAWHS